MTQPPKKQPSNTNIDGFKKIVHTQPRGIITPSNLSHLGYARLSQDYRPARTGNGLFADKPRVPTIPPPQSRVTVRVIQQYASQQSTYKTVIQPINLQSTAIPIEYSNLHVRLSRLKKISLHTQPKSISHTKSPLSSPKSIPKSSPVAVPVRVPVPVAVPVRVPVPVAVPVRVPVAVPVAVPVPVPVPVAVRVPVPKINKRPTEPQQSRRSQASHKINLPVTPEESGLYTPSQWQKTQTWNPHSETILPPQKNRFNKHKRRSKLKSVDYSLTFVLLVMAVALGFNLTLGGNVQSALASNRQQVAGTSESIPISTDSEILGNGEGASSDSSKKITISQAEFEQWMSQHYPNQATDDKTSIANSADLSAQVKPPVSSGMPTNGIMELFGVTDIEQLNKVTLDPIVVDQQITNAQRKNQYLVLSKRIDDYISAFRSYEPFDNQLGTPLNGMSYIAVSEQTGMPIKYMMAIARAESRFGTDRFTASGNLTRPGAHLNPCSIGLDDSGGNISFKNWEEGLIACGKWYQYFQNKGVSDCRKWGIFNPNGDYCSKIETLAAEINTFLNKV